MAFNGNPTPKDSPKRAGWKTVIFILILLLIAGVGVSRFVASFGALMRDNPAYTEGVQQLMENKAAMAVLGRPIEVGDMLGGTVRLNNLDGVARYQLAVKGNTCEGVYYIRADKHMGTWDIYLLVLQSDCASAPLVLRNTRNVLFLEESAIEA